MEDLNGYFSSVFTREDTSSLPVPDVTFQEAKLDYLGQLIVTPERVAKKIKAMNITSKNLLELKFADDTKVFREVNNDAGKQ